MRLLVLLLIPFLNFIASPLSSQCFKICSWNVQNLGKSKDAKTISLIAETLKDFDFVCIQEVSTSPAGAQAVAAISDELNRKGAKWDYKVSDPTQGKGSERYAFLWKTSKGKLMKSWLENSLANEVDREPFLGFFVIAKDTFLIATFHAVPKKKNPDQENTKLSIIDEKYEKNHLLIMGDFNSPAGSKGFGTIYDRKMQATFKKEKTTLKAKVNAKGEHLANSYDNIFYEADEIDAVQKGVIDFSTKFSDLKEARRVSDHLPVWGCYVIKR